MSDAARCEQCGQPIPPVRRPRWGDKRRFCSRACSADAVRGRPGKPYVEPTLDEIAARAAVVRSEWDDETLAKRSTVKVDEWRPPTARVHPW